jgi:membrane-bound lytic murein transglycosylase D
MKRKITALFLFGTGVAVGLGVFALVSYKAAEPAPTAAARRDEPANKWYLPELPTVIDFAGENTPLEKWEVKERLEREVVTVYFSHGSEMNIMLLSGRYFPVIEAKLKENGVPDDFKYLCIAESSLHLNAVSSAGAVSFWQFMKTTAPHYGLEVTDEIDERFDVEKATEAACKYFKEAYQKFGTWTAAAASYNCGQAGYDAQCKFQNSTNYYDLIFPDETNRYIFRILSIKYLLTNAKKLGFMLEQSEKLQPLPYKTITVENSIENLAEFAAANNTSYKMLKMYNPWMRAHKLTVRNGKKYTLKLPK